MAQVCKMKASFFILLLLCDHGHTHRPEGSVEDVQQSRPRATHKSSTAANVWKHIKTNLGSTSKSVSNVGHGIALSQESWWESGLQKIEDHFDSLVQRIERGWPTLPNRPRWATTATQYRPFKGSTFWCRNKHFTCKEAKNTDNVTFGKNGPSGEEDEDGGEDFEEAPKKKSGKDDDGYFPYQKWKWQVRRRQCGLVKLGRAMALGLGILAAAALVIAAPIAIPAAASGMAGWALISPIVGAIAAASTAAQVGIVAGTGVAGALLWERGRHAIKGIHGWDEAKPTCPRVTFKCLGGGHPLMTEVGISIRAFSMLGDNLMIDQYDLGIGMMACYAYQYDTTSWKNLLLPTIMDFADRTKKIIANGKQDPRLGMAWKEIIKLAKKDVAGFIREACALAVCTMFEMFSGKRAEQLQMFFNKQQEALNGAAAPPKGNKSEGEGEEEED